MNEPTQRAPIKEAHRTMRALIRSTCQEFGQSLTDDRCDQLIADFCQQSEARAVAEVESECARVKAREVTLSDRQTYLHMALCEANIPDHTGEDETYKSFGLTERVQQLAGERDAAVKRAEAAEAERDQLCALLDVPRAPREVKFDELIEKNRQIEALRGRLAALRELVSGQRQCLDRYGPNCIFEGVGQISSVFVEELESALASTASVPPIPDPSDTLDSRGVAEDERNPVPPAEKEKTS